MTIIDLYSLSKHYEKDPKAAFQKLLKGYDMQYIICLGQNQDHQHIGLYQGKWRTLNILR